ncbi:hypothetical protein [Clostridium cylindrosporum]|uniref:Uncharacterized protein n=1 Tax=Clostridium cylindrosporum DSM 605 TaxID=1121307 RepID=A0A0J8D8T9_CLOCY|nr:hypothetical protein [Clostridium cylindrosporum]KMT22292.1 hypothetical protein CLCY_4c02650 [Clostridium cylindrosporum DSM 605]
MSIISYQDNIGISPGTSGPVAVPPQTINIQGQSEVFGNKFTFWQGQPTNPGVGDDLGFTLVFGNYGETDFPAGGVDATVEDTLTVPAGVTLELKSVSLPPSFIIGTWDGVAFTPLTLGQTFVGAPVNGTVYTLQLRQGPLSNEVPNFALTENSVYSVGLLLNVVGI